MTLTVAELVERLSRLDQSALVYTAHLRKDGVSMALVPVVWTAEKDGKILLVDPDLFRVFAAAKHKSN